MATLTDVIGRMKQEGDLNRNSGTHSIKSLKETITTGLGSLERSVMALRQSMVNSNIAIRKIGEALDVQLDDEPEEERAARDRVTSVLDDPEPKKEGLGNLIGTLKGLTKSFGNFAKKLVPSRGGFLAAVLGGLAGLALFFPDWLEKNIINPIVDLFLGGTETWLGRVRSYIESTFNFIKDNFGEEAAWIAALAAGLAFLNPLTTGTIMFKAVAGLSKLALRLGEVALNLGGKALSGFGRLALSLGRFVGPMALPLLAAAAIYGLVTAMEALAGKNAENDIKRLADLRAEADNAAAEGDKARVKAIQGQIAEIQKRASELGGEAGKLIGDAAKEAMGEVAPLVRSMAETATVQADESGDVVSGTTLSIAESLTDAFKGLEFKAGTAQGRFDEIKNAMNTATMKLTENAEFQALGASEQQKLVKRLFLSRNTFLEEQARRSSRAKIGLDSREKSKFNNLIGQEIKSQAIGSQEEINRIVEQSQETGAARLMLDYMKTNQEFQQRALDLIDERALETPGSGGGVNVNAPSVKQGDSNDNRQTQITNNNYTTYQNGSVATPAALF